jgi:hypothetical protein
MTLETANTWFSLAPRLALVLGPLVAGLLVTTVGAVNTLYLDAAIFFVSAAHVTLPVGRIWLTFDDPRSHGGDASGHGAMRHWLAHTFPV